MTRLVALGLLVCLGAAILRLDWPKYQRLKARGVWVEGWVTAKGLGEKDSVSYSFLVGSKLYSGEGRAGYGNPAFPSLAVEDRVIVYYLPQNPDVSCLGVPMELLREQNRVMAWLILILGMFLGLILYQEFNSRPDVRR